MTTILCVVIAILLVALILVKWEGEHRFKQMKVRFEYARDKAKQYELKTDALLCEIDYLKEEQDILKTDYKERYKRLQERACAADIENQKTAVIDELDEEFKSEEGSEDE